MKNYKFLILFLVLWGALSAHAQRDSITQLDEVLISDVKLYKNSRAQVVSVLSDSIIAKNEPSLNSLLKFNTPIYFKENGNGMVSSPSFRGTTASQTAVVWNGININSLFNGQTDFNTVNTSAYDNIAVRAGGGSVLYGSGAIGGSVHLNNRFSFDGKFRNRLGVEIGSFETHLINYSSEFSSEKTSVYGNFSGIQSENDYKYLGTEKRNENGDFYNLSVSAGIAHWLNEKNILRFYTDYYHGERAFSGTLTAPSRSKYEDVNSKNLLEWKGFYNAFTSSLKLAFLDENYKYFENRNRDNFTFGHAQTYIAKYDLTFELNPDMTLHGIADYRNTDGKGSDVGENVRNIAAFAILFNHDFERFFYELSARKEITDTYESPFLYSLSTGYSVTPFYDLAFNFSRNFRIPTYNDLFWSSGGNLDLDPENSFQGELGQKFHFSNFEFGVVAYLMKIENLLRWIPDDRGLWRPENTESVKNYGLEFRGKYKKSYKNHDFILNVNYSYTKTNDEIKDRELIYTPNHKATGSLGYSVKKFSFFYQFLYNGSIYTSSDNNYELEGYTVSNAGIGYSFGKKDFVNVGLEVRNIYNKEYQSLPSRPMPGRSINSSLTIKF
ncbi:TonB-dependent receptor plug domain-containing protein [Autumnicola psychrophila]|uniref:TonB-dependent receptor n=1 Tax=Autumnicola psychrophila TaxID=3075592 RepID=A0ABU3DSL1_9FLAO|nr:TonB-dependent receptor [Zunongwangia sp. F225]MDT0686703.1 TonB-dependent receptor [Zunongwangia sp. F225]